MTTLIVTGSNGFVGSTLAVFVGKIFDLLAFITRKDLPINSDRMRKFSISTDYRSEKIRELGYVQNHSIEQEIQKTCQWYLKKK